MNSAPSDPQRDTEPAAEERHTIVDAAHVEVSGLEVECTWADNTGYTNVFEGIHYCPFCGWVIDPKEQVTTNTTTSSEPAAPQRARQDVVGIAADTNTSVGDVANVVQQMITVLGYDAVVATTDPGLHNHELTETAADRVREIMLDTSCRRVALMDGDVRIFEPAPGSDDVFRMYVLDVLDFSVVVRRRRNKDGVIESVVDISEDPGGVLTVHVRGIENTYESSQPAQDSVQDSAALSWDAHRAVSGQDGYFWTFTWPDEFVRLVYRDSDGGSDGDGGGDADAVVVGSVGLHRAAYDNPHHEEPFSAFNADEEWLATSGNPDALTQVVALHDRAARLGAQRAVADARQGIADHAADHTDPETIDEFKRCVERAGFQDWDMDYGPVGNPLSGRGDGLSPLNLLDELGVDTEPDDPIQIGLALRYVDAYRVAWRKEILRTARERIAQADQGEQGEQAESE